MDNQNGRFPVMLDIKRIFIIRENITKKDIVAKLVKSICMQVPSLKEEEVISSVLKREHGISTTLDSGLSIPHARINNIDTFHAAMAVLPNGIKDDYGLEAKVLFLFLSPAAPNYFSAHLKLLAALAEKFNSSFIQDLLNTPKEEDIFKKINL